MSSNTTYGGTNLKTLAQSILANPQNYNITIIRNANYYLLNQIDEATFANAIKFLLPNTTVPANNQGNTSNVMVPYLGKGGTTSGGTFGGVGAGFGGTTPPAGTIIVTNPGVLNPIISTGTSTTTQLANQQATQVAQGATVQGGKIVTPSTGSAQTGNTQVQQSITPPVNPTPTVIPRVNGLPQITNTTMTNISNGTIGTQITPIFTVLGKGDINCTYRGRITFSDGKLGAINVYTAQVIQGWISNGTRLYDPQGLFGGNCGPQNQFDTNKIPSINFSGGVVAGGILGVAALATLLPHKAKAKIRRHHMKRVRNRHA